MSKMTAKPREFELYRHPDAPRDIDMIHRGGLTLWSEVAVGERIPVIEKSAFDQLAAELALAKQDRDSWRRTHKVTEDGANDLIEQLEARVRELEAENKRLETMYKVTCVDTANERAALEKQVAELQLKIRVMEHAD